MSQPESSLMANRRNLFKIVMKGDWHEVIQIYKDDLAAQRSRITRSGYTPLHLAVSDGMEDVVEQLIDVIMETPFNKAVAMQTDVGNTPLHIAASIGNVRMCKLISRVDPTLIGIQNKDGETPLFLAALHGEKDAFLCLHSFCLPRLGMSYCRRNDGNSILHCAIVGEYFDLAFQIIQLYRGLVDSINSEGLTPLHVLATKPSAFESGSNLGRFQKMVYKFLFVNKLKANETYEEKTSYKIESKPSCPQNYQTLVNFFHCITPEDDASSTTSAEEEIHTIENPTTGTKKEPEQKGDQSALETGKKDFLSPNYVTCFEFVKFVFKAILVLTRPGYGGVTNILDEKRKHTLSVQVLDELLQGTNIYEYENAGQAPPTHIHNNEIKELHVPKEKGSEVNNVPETTKQDSAILIAAKHGITEMVEKILEKFPVAIHDTKEDKKNMVLIAVENRQLEVYKLLLRKYGLKEGIFRKVDRNGDGALHFAAKLTKAHPRWPIPGDALQMQWEIKWLKFVEESKPKHFFARYNSKGETPDEIFTESHTNLVKYGGKWMKDTAESCSVVAALIATVAFATSTTVPGSVDHGKPPLKNKPGFQVYAMASLIALCFSVNSLVMFLAILTSRYQEKDFGRNLPRKLLLGLASLFVSIASMLVSFCAGHFFVLENTIRYAAFPMYALTGVPVTFFAAAQFPLYFDLIRATFRSPFGDPTK